MGDLTSLTEQCAAERNAFRDRLESITDVDNLRTIALKQFDIRQGGYVLLRHTEMVEAARAQREASHAISAAVDWTAQSRRPTLATLRERRGEAA